MATPLDKPRLLSEAGVASPAAGEAALALSVVVPVFNEEDNIGPLHERIRATLDELDLAYEVIVVDDGSTDATFERLATLAHADERLRVIRFRRNFGQTAAMAAGFHHANGDVIVPIDGDLQNDPADIPRLLAKIEEGYDVVSGWRRERKDSRLLRRLPSAAANRLIGLVTGLRLHDYGCTLKAYRAEILKETRLYGEMHRFLPALAQQIGARVTEIPVRHHPRTAGQSKYGLRRTLKVVLDLVTLKFLLSYSTKPIYVFGSGGLVLCAGGVLAGTYTLYQKYANDIYVHRNPAILLAIFLFFLGVMFILMGLLAELVIRTYHESQQKPTYWVRDAINVDRATAG